MRFPWTRTEGWAQCRYPKMGNGYWHYYRVYSGNWQRALFKSACWFWRPAAGTRLHRKPKGERCPVCARRKHG